MKKPLNLINVFLLVVLLSSCNNGAQKIPFSANGEKPNIIFILTDDQRWDALGFAGNSDIQTPNMDQLASSGLYFKNAFVTTPICAASRASILTGLYERTHNYTFGQPNLDDQYMYDTRRSIRPSEQGAIV